MKYFYGIGRDYNKLSNSVDGLNYELDKDYDEGIEIKNEVYGFIAHSDMTGMNMAIVSNKKSDIDSITSDEVMRWFDEGDSDSWNWDWTMFYGLPIETDENGSLNCFREGYMFDEPLFTLIPKIKEEYGELSNDELENILISEYGEKYGRTYVLDGDASVYPNSLIVSPKRESWRF